MRPLSVSNDGNANTFLTCSFTTAGPIIAVTVRASVQDAVADNITCTGVSGFLTGSNESIPKAAALSANGAQSSLKWKAADFNGAPSTFPGSNRFSMTCALAPGVGINDAEVQFREDVGA